MNIHVSDEEIKKDLKETLEEVRQLRRELEFSVNRINASIEERMVFITRLENVLKDRGVQ